MCGFGGVINHPRPLSVEELGPIASQVRFRGPDSCGIKIFDEQLQLTDRGNSAFFFNRLAILDLADRSNQPFEDEDFLLAFNGEIYNYKALKNELERSGVTFRTTSDTEVLFHALRIWDKSALPKLNGMFAFFWLNKREKKFLICRDRLGIKPFYYHQHGNAFYFSSEINSIVRLSGRKPEISAEAAEMYLWMQSVPTPFSIIRNIHKLPPGSYIEASTEPGSAAHQPRFYWDAYTFASEAIQDPSEDLEQILRGSIQRQMQADVPLGLFLSSGIDSSLMAAIVVKYFTKEEDVNFFTVSFGEKTLTDESGDALDFIKGFHNPHLKNHLLSVDANYLNDHLEDLYDYYDEPFADYASLLNWIISRKAREFVTVALSGDGADELFWGYSRYDKWKKIRKLQARTRLPQGMGKMAGYLPSNRYSDAIQLIAEPDPVQTHFDLFLLPGFKNYFKKDLTSHGLWALNNTDAIVGREDLPAVLDIKTYLADTMLYKVDRSSMATSLEVRVPYLDNEVVEFALKLPFSQKSNSLFHNKAILKELLVRLAPHYNTELPKRGFSFPIKNWMRTYWKNQVLASVTPVVLEELGLRPKPLMKLVHDCYEKGMDYELEVWYLFNLALWKNKFDKMTAQLQG